MIKLLDESRYVDTVSFLIVAVTDSNHLRMLLHQVRARIS